MPNKQKTKQNKRIFIPFAKLTPATKTHIFQVGLVWKKIAFTNELCMHNLSLLTHIMPM